MAAEHPMRWVKKQRTGLFNRHPFERKSSSIKAKGRQSQSTGFARDFGSLFAGTKPSGRTLDLYIYIYIANDESPSQHVTVGLAEARPNYIYIANGESPSQHVTVGLAEARPNKDNVNRVGFCQQRHLSSH